MTPSSEQAAPAELLDGLRVAAVIVTYNPEPLAFSKVLVALRAQVARVVIVDNGSAPATADALRVLARIHDCVFVGLEANSGIAAAQNRGIEAIASEHEWSSAPSGRYVLFLDHDSIAADDMVQRLLQADLRLRAHGITVGAVGPVVVDARTGSAGSFIRFRRWWLTREKCNAGCSELDVVFLISSGTLVRLDALNDIGGMDERLFIDHVDTEWCLRAASRHYRLFAACDARITHSLGDEVIRVWLGRWREVFVHSPLRDYYMCRNTALLLRSVRMSFAWRSFLILRMIGSIAFFGLLVRPRSVRLCQMARGLMDGVRD